MLMKGLYGRFMKAFSRNQKYAIVYSCAEENNAPMIQMIQIVLQKEKEFCCVCLLESCDKMFECEHTTCKTCIDAMTNHKLRTVCPLCRSNFKRVPETCNDSLLLRHIGNDCLYLTYSNTMDCCTCDSVICCC